jgi:hypothetical protein
MTQQYSTHEREINVHGEDVEVFRWWYEQYTIHTIAATAIWERCNSRRPVEFVAIRVVEAVKVSLVLAGDLRYG